MTRTKSLQRIRIAFFTLIAGLLLCSNASAQTNELESHKMTVMSFNIRYGLAKDGDNHWDKRRDLVAKTIRDFDPDLLGTQESLPFQAAYLRQQLAKYDYVGRSREEKDGAGGEQCGIFFRRARFNKLAEGHFWLSEEPNRPGSKSWDSSLPRMATWVRLWDKQTERAIFFCNTHFDHRGATARERSAELIVKQMLHLANGLPAILTGDFNAPEGSAPYYAIFGGDPSKGMVPVTDVDHLGLRDTFRVTNPKKGSAEGTFNGFKGKTTSGRIDWIGVSRMKIRDAKINSSNDNGRYPSDHFPVTTVARYYEDTE